MLYNKISFSEMVSKNNKNKNNEIQMNALIVSNVNVKRTSDIVFKYIMESEFGINVIAKGVYDNELRETLDKDLVYDYVFIIFHLENIQVNIDFKEKMILFYHNVLSALEKVNANILCINDLNVLDIDYYERLQIIERVKTKCVVDHMEMYDIQTILTQIGINYLYDQRKFYSYNNPYSLEGYIELSLFFVRNYRKDNKLAKKCLVLDCDNVLWGKALDAVGKNGIVLDLTYPGNVYYDFQKYILELVDKGIIITLCSKNDEEDVIDVMKTHPFMLLNMDNIASYRVNWNSKVENILSLSDELNISLEDMIFIDDSEDEIGLVKQMIPNIYTFVFDDNFKYNYRNIISGLGLFSQSKLTSEDISRNRMYREERKRRKIKYLTEDEEDYLQILNLRLNTEKINEFNIERAVQMTERTHRANLTSRKYEVNDFIDMKNIGYEIKCYTLSDKYGEYGYICTVILKKEPEAILIKDWYMSCRALGKNVESMIIDDILSEYDISKFLFSYEYKNNGKNGEYVQLLDKILNNKNVKNIKRKLI